MLALALLNSDFLSAVYGEFAPEQYGWVASFAESPATAHPSVWSGTIYKHLPAQAAQMDKALHCNNYFCPTLLRASAEGAVRRKGNFHQLACLTIDDALAADYGNFSYVDQALANKTNLPLRQDLLMLRKMLSEEGLQGVIRYVQKTGGAGLPAVALVPSLSSPLSERDER
jgi:hypothetical protein